MFFNKEVLSYITVLIDGELVEWSKAPHWKCGVPQGTEGSNPSLSAIFFAKKMANEDVSLHFTVPSGTTSLKTEGFLPCRGVMQ